jgi:serine/threonine protein kinase
VTEAWLCVALAGAVQHEKFQSAPGSRVGTPAYLAPEVILTTRGKTYDGKVRPPQPTAAATAAAAATAVEEVCCVAMHMTIFQLGCFVADSQLCLLCATCNLPAARY